MKNSVGRACDVWKNCDNNRIIEINLFAPGSNSGAGLKNPEVSEETGFNLTPEFDSGIHVQTF